MQYLAKQDLSKLLRTIHGANATHHMASLIAFWTGARISQVLNVRGEDIFEMDGKWVIKIRAAKRGNATIHTLHLDSDNAFDMSPIIELAKTKRQSRLLGGLSRQYYNLCFKRYADMAGIHSDFAHSHVWRHSVAMQIWDATQRVGAISQFLGHRSSTAALCYLAENDGKLGQEAVDLLQLA